MSEKEKIELQGFEVEYDASLSVPSVEDETTSQEAQVEEPAEKDPTPAYGSNEWSDYVLSLLTPDELFNGNPLCFGLRRLALLLLGPIVSSKPVQVFPSMDPNGPGRATVVYEVIIDWGGNGELRVFGDVAETWHGNTDDLFCAHAAATSSTKAEGRCLRKALMVKCLAAEELANGKDVAAIVRNSVKVEAPTTGVMVDSDKISDAQFKLIENKCKQLDINLLKFVNFGTKQYKSVGEITKRDASTMIQTINSYQNEKPAPPEIKGFDPNWRATDEQNRK